MKAKWLVFLFTIILMVGSINIGSVGAEEVDLLTTDHEGLDTSQETEESYLQDEMISPYFIKTIEESSEYTKTLLSFPAGSDDVTMIYPVNILEKGIVAWMVKENDTIVFSNLTLELYSNKACTKQCGSASYHTNEEDELKQIFCPKAGTYYLKVVFKRKENVEDAKSFTLGSYFISNEDRALTTDVMTFTYSDKQHKDVMYKVTAKKAGVIVFTIFPTDYTSDLSGKVTLYNAKKKSISSIENISNIDSGDSDVKYAKSYFIVKKGTYYIKLSSYSSTGYYLVGYTLVDVKDTSGSSIKKAGNIKIGNKAKGGMLSITDSVKKEEWYKLKLTKKMKFTIVVDAYVSGKIKMEVCDSKGKTFLSGTSTLTTSRYTLPTKGKWSKGTYYIKLTKSNQKSCGYYEIKIKK